MGYQTPAIKIKLIGCLIPFLVAFNFHNPQPSILPFLQVPISPCLHFSLSSIPSIPSIPPMKETPTILLTETPRDAMQGFRRNIPTAQKAEYINQLLKCGFDSLDCGSFVSAKAVPQMVDTAEVISLLNTDDSITKPMVLVGNIRGGKQAAAENKIHTIAFPYSVSGTFLKRNLNTTPEAAMQTALELIRLCDISLKELRIYVTMAFGNPYGDDWNDEMVISEVEKLYAEGVRHFVFSDITGEGTSGNIERLSSELINSFQGATMGIHLHTKSDNWEEKVEAAWRGGMRNFDSAVGGFGGCPMTGYELLGNLDTIHLVDWCSRQGIETGLNKIQFRSAINIAGEVFK